MKKVAWDFEPEIVGVALSQLQNLQAPNGKVYSACKGGGTCVACDGSPCSFTNEDGDCSDKSLPCVRGRDITIDGDTFTLSEDIVWKEYK